MVDFKRSKNGRYLDVCAECSPSKFAPKLPKIKETWIPGKRKGGTTPDFCDKCGYNRKTARKGDRCHCRGGYDLNGQPKPLRRGINRRQWFGLPKEVLAERMRWYQSATERKAAAEIQDIAYCFNCPYKAQYVLHGFIVDFFYPKIGLIVEVDGPHHEAPGQRQYDQERDAILMRKGYSLHRISYRDLDAHGAKAATKKLRSIIQSKLADHQHKQNTDE
jgi:very-short-patch-repair endonuclease